MYDQLFKAWKAELENDELQTLPPEFFAGLAEYVKTLKEQGRMLEKRSLKTNLLNREMQNARRMIRSLVRARSRKIIDRIARGMEMPKDVLTVEEKTLYSRISVLPEAVQSFLSDLMKGQTPRIKTAVEHRMTALRFLKDVPAVIGADMKTYGPFNAEDVAALPLENSRILMKQGLAEKVEID